MQTVHSHALAAFALAAAGFAVYAGLPRSPVLVDDPILAISAPSLTTVKVTAATNEQDIRPLAGQRGTNLDGIVRARPMQRMVLGGNPFENVWKAASTVINSVTPSSRFSVLIALVIDSESRISCELPSNV